MLLIFKTTVAAAGTPGPLLGDGTKTTCTLISVSALTETDGLGGSKSVVNRVAAQGRARYTVARAVVVGLGANSGNVYLMGAGQAAAVARRAAAYEELTPLGGGVVNDVDLGDLDVDAAASGDGWLVFAEVR